AQPRLPLPVSDREELSASLSGLPLEPQVEELSRSLGFQMDENKGLRVPERAKGDDFKLHQVIMEEERDGSSQAVQHHTPEKS
ncbi:hypothetical protein DV515_00001269, partial [Chloebia gouldiae]